jgi:hypothetical protein
MQREHIAELSGNVVWHGRTEDGERLVALVGTHCHCGHRAGLGRVPPVCGAHQLLADQHALDHLAFARTVVNRSVDEEWRVSASPNPASNASNAEWAAFLYACAHDLPTVGIANPDSRPRAARARSAFVVSLLALLLVLGLGTPSISFHAPPAQPIASWQTR